MSASARYGNFAMEIVINEILSRGGRRDRLEIKLFGGGDVLATGTRVGSRNVAFVQDYLRNEQLTAVASDLGGDTGRRIHYFPDTGKVMRKLFARDPIVEKEELRHLKKLRKQTVGGEVELFD